MTTTEIIEKYIGTTTSIVQLKGTTAAEVLLINNSYVLKSQLTSGVNLLWRWALAVSIS